jgi:hypothetical protein
MPRSGASGLERSLNDARAGERQPGRDRGPGAADLPDRPILIFASVAVARILDQYPVLILAGGALLGWVAGETAVSDPAIKDWIDRQSLPLGAIAPLMGAAYVLIHGRLAGGRWPIRSRP